MTLTPNETTLLITALTAVLSAFLSFILWILNKGVSKIETIANSLINMERDFKVLVNDHTNLKDDVKEIDERVRSLETSKHK